MITIDLLAAILRAAVPNYTIYTNSEHSDVWITRGDKDIVLLVCVPDRGVDIRSCWICNKEDRKVLKTVIEIIDILENDQEEVVTTMVTINEKPWRCNCGSNIQRKIYANFYQW